MKSYPRYLVYWSSEGLESVLDLREIEREILIGLLKDEKTTFEKKVNNIISGMILRARYNSHRKYEIYVFDTESSITLEMVKEQFEENPQGMVDLIREKGIQLFTSGAIPKPPVIK